ncbi:MAG: hypothetical protein J5813_01435 [Candidatus Methanomethylophilaceae archaeon]|nr:hypothetical protein [Candidatus Methanomethylophilaceae archaeon]
MSALQDFHSFDIPRLIKDSQSNPCIQLLDFIAGASHAKCEHGDNTLEILSEKISVARRY